MHHEDLPAYLAGRVGWTVDTAATIAIYEPIAGGWTAVIRRLNGTGHGRDRYDRWHLAVVDPVGRCHYSKPETHLSEARRRAEGQVNALS